mmetsp:Transcript_9013/g.18779  ORF Transcript_9013/g.18779 Transcript_9013/m.18779 type:complete len:165 (-) Transcript_9013:227-721(-)
MGLNTGDTRRRKRLVWRRRRSAPHVVVSGHHSLVARHVGGGGTSVIAIAILAKKRHQGTQTTLQLPLFRRSGIATATAVGPPRAGRPQCLPSLLVGRVSARRSRARGRAVRSAMPGAEARGVDLILDRDTLPCLAAAAAVAPTAGARRLRTPATRPATPTTIHC